MATLRNKSAEVAEDSYGKKDHFKELEAIRQTRRENGKVYYYWDVLSVRRPKAIISQKQADTLNFGPMVDLGNLLPISVYVPAAFDQPKFKLEDVVQDLNSEEFPVPEGWNFE